MQNFKDRLKGTTERLRSLGGPADGVERRVISVVERATSEMIINPDWGVNMELVDIINTEPHAACYDRVFRALRRRLWKSNPKIQILTLTLLETCVKNTGSEFQAALAGSDFWEEVHRLADPKKKADLQVQDKILILVEDCAHALGAPGYKAAYDGLKGLGVRFPTRPAEEIGAGFNLPPTRQDASAMQEVSEEDQRAIQEALKDLSSQPPPSEPQQAPVTGYPAAIGAESDAEKLRSDLRFVANSVELLKDALGSIPLNEPELVHQDYIKDLSGQCTETVPRLKKLIEGASDEGILAEALMLNDELGTVLQRYEEMTKKGEDAKKPVTAEEPSLLGLDDDLTPAPVGSVTQGSSSSQPPPPVDDFAALASGSSTQPVTADPFSMLAAQSTTSAPQQPSPIVQPPPPVVQPLPTIQPPPGAQPPPKKSDDPFDDLISL